MSSTSSNTKVAPKGIRAAAARGAEAREARRKKAAELYAESLKDRKGCKKLCCTGPKDWKEAFAVGTFKA
jgi:hypothetical protein